MRTGIKKALAGKTMRVATTFTGVAACAVGFAPVANAATGHITNQPARTHDLNVGRLRAVRPDIQSRNNCPGGTANWFHLAYNKSLDDCFGFTGTAIASYSHPLYYATSFCGGNNAGWISGYYDTGNHSYYFRTFGHGTTYAHIPHTNSFSTLAVTGLHISGYSGNDKCPLP